MKKLISIALLIILSILCLTGCDNNAEENHRKALEQELEEQELEEENNSDVEGEICLNMDKQNIWLYNYRHTGSSITITIENNYKCLWVIKSYSQVRVSFTDGSYKSVSLGTNVNISPNESYTFKDCFLGSQHETKTVKSIRFMD